LASQINASNSGFGGIVSTGDSSGVLQLQAAGTTIATIQSTGLNLGSNGVVFSDSSSQTAAASPYVLKNRIINGDMRIDQRNAGASITPTNGQFSVDRWACFLSQSSKYTVQQDAGAVTPPAGFNDYLGVTSSSAYTVGSAEWFGIAQRIEGFNIADLAWGTANARTVTLSFWVRSSLTGTFGGSLNNSGFNYNYPFSYTISATNTWEYKTITIAGPTAGTWLTTNGAGVQVHFGLGLGSTYSATAGSWVTTSNILSATGATSVVGTNGATFYITGVQLEVGSTATPFERRLYGQELVNCQRYYYKWTNDNAGVVDFCTFQIYASGSAFGKLFDFPVTMRATPTGTSSGTFRPYNATGTAQPAFSTTNIDSLTKQHAAAGAWTGSSGMTAGNVTVIRANANTFIDVSAEL
jgi:hypothetical protein